MTMTGADARRWADAKQLDYGAIGFRCGLEIHQQLDTGKLFSRVPSAVLEPEEIARRTVGEVTRTLRATGSESGAVDAAAAAESRRGRRFRYLAIEGLTSLVELDEEPPRPLDGDALDVGLTFAGLLGARPVDEVHVMRKTVIDGSNTSGFQRTALIATGGRFPVEGGDVGVWTIALEEDSARPLEEKDGVATYTLDRLGIPLLEVATAPDVRDPAHAQRTAARLGALLRATGRVKRGLGTIRQDLNVSVGVGARVEIKGCQDLRAVPRVIEAECRRQLWMHHVAGELAARGFDPEQVPPAVHVGAAFANTQAKAVADGAKKGHAVLAQRLPKMAGLLRGASKDGPRLGRELADHARVAAGVKGIFHSDELPGYGITPDEVQAVRVALGCGPDDAFAICVERDLVARRALDAVADRARLAVGAARSEVRGAQPDDSTRYMRPMPGAARMYPETDVPPIRVRPEAWRAVLGRLPPLPEQRVEALAKAGLSVDLAQQLVADDLEPAFARLRAAGAEPAVAARTLLQDLAALEHADAVRPRLDEVFAALAAGRFAKEAVPAILKVLDAEPRLPIADAIAKAGVAAADTATVDAVIARVLAERADFVKARGMAALGPLMGPVMAELRGKADGQVISARLKDLLAKAAQ
ncbi:MAG: glutamyl-tRNA(Gln) amidotransferase subunit [Thermoplasmata archaeon]|jgi:glutamyl-tRNA(Gln) amidotransferase subunit E|nr:glutamyl-tRNA(Gln) amidotransferase subunit [Thermoplasmata archaeon]